MKAKKGKLLWIVLGFIVLAIAAMSLNNCVNASTSVNYSEFYSIISNESVMQDGVITKEEKKQQYYQRMLGECKSMERLVSDLLLFSKMQNPDFLVEKEYQ